MRNDVLRKTLDVFSERLKDVPVRENSERMKKTLKYERTDRLVYSPTPTAFFKDRFPSDELGLPHYKFSEVEESVENMLVSSIQGFLKLLDLSADLRPIFGVIPGVAFIPAVLGCRMRVMDSDMTPEQFTDESEAKRFISRGIPDFSSGMVAQLIERIEVAMKWLECYPVLRDNFYISAPCCQGPFDNVHQITGSKIFYWLVEQPDLVKELLNLLTETHIRFQRYFESYISTQPYGNRVVFNPYSFTGSTATRLVEDTCCNISQDMQEEFSVPYDELIFNAFSGSGWVHYCGMLSHTAGRILEMRGLKGADLPGLSAGYGDHLEEFWAIANSKKIGLELSVSLPEYPSARNVLDFIQKNKICTGIMLSWAVDSFEMATQYRRQWEEVNKEIFGD